MPRSSAATQRRILDAAYAQFRRKGFTRVSMDDIAAAATLTKRTLYYHFKSKDMLLAEVLEGQHAFALAAFRSFGDRLAGSPEAIIETMFHDLCGLGRYAPAGRLRFYALGIRACRFAWTFGAPDCAPT
jgi:AcrR family transcriptional regulator